VDSDWLTAKLMLGRMTGAAIRGLRYFVETYEPVDMLFDVFVEGRRTGRVGTGRLTNI
jgi:hypothetical protein